MTGGLEILIRGSRKLTRLTVMRRKAVNKMDLGNKMRREKDTNVDNESVSVWRVSRELNVWVCQSTALLWSL